MIIVEYIFWISLFIVFYTYVGYGIVLYILVKIKEIFISSRDVLLPDDEDLPQVSLLIAAYNEESVVDDKIKNCNEIDYPSDKLKVIWVTDGSNDNTNELLAKYPGVRVLFEPVRAGKTAAVNRAITYIETPIVVFTDANTYLNKESIKEIVKKFTDPKVGCVAGEKRIQVKDKDVASSSGEGFYWKYESFLKALDSRLYSAVGAAGELYAIRTNFYENMDKTTLLDDFIQSMRIAQKGYKISYCDTAYAVESGSLDMGEEKKRKVRIAAGGLQSILKLTELLNCFKYPVLSFQYISHRVLRWSISPLLLFLLLPLNIILLASDMQSPLYAVLLILQLIFYVLGYLGYSSAKKNIKNKFLFVPYYFIFMNANVFLGFKYLMKKRSDGTWEKAKRAA